MLKPYAFANSFATVGLVVYVLCWLLSAVAPDLLFAISKSWIHSLNLEAVKTVASLDLGSALLGAVTFGGFIWLISFAGAYLYNRWEK